MYILYWLGTMLEPAMGHVRFSALYFASLLAGSFGAIAMKPHALTVGASGAVFGLMAAAFIFQRARGIDPWRSGLGPVILLNLALPFVFTNLNISIGGRIGGLIGGAVAALAIDGSARCAAATCCPCSRAPPSRSSRSPSARRSVSWSSTDNSLWRSTPASLRIP